jgi:hypothetical protein
MQFLRQGGRLTMVLNRGALELIICLILIALSVLGAISTFVLNLVHDIDGVLLLLVCTLMGSTFSVMAFVIAKRHSWLSHLAISRTRVNADAASVPELAHNQK